MGVVSVCVGDMAKQGGSDLDKFEALCGQSFGNGGNRPAAPPRRVEVLLGEVIEGRGR